MNNIAQNYKNIIKNLIKNKIKSLNDDIVDKIIDSISDNNQKNYINIVASIEESVKNMIKNILVVAFEAIDQQYRDSYIRKKFYNINKSSIPRTITTIFGDITFKRTYYQSKVNNEYIFLLDDVLGLPKYDRYDPIVKATAINIYTKTNQKIAGEIVGCECGLINDVINNIKLTIPRQSINNWIGNWNIPNIHYGARTTPETLYIMADEKFLGSQDTKNDIMVKSFVVFEENIKVSKNRNKLKNRFVFNTISSSPWVDFVDLLYSIYDSSKIKSIYVMSDGGNWIKKNIYELKVEDDINIKRLHCEFHFKQAINRISTDEGVRKAIFNSFIHLPRSSFIQVLDYYQSIFPNRFDKIEAQKNYIVNNYTAIKDMLGSNIGSSMESHISHIIARPFGSRPKGFSSKKIQKYLLINDLFNNEVNIFNLYLNSYFLNNNSPCNKISLSVNNSDASTHNIPIVDNAHITPLYSSLKDLSYGI